jgi:hypothetical protein
MPVTEGLIIPIRLDPTKAAADLGKVGAAGKKAGDDVGKGMEGAAGKVKKVEEATKGLGGELAGLMKGQMTLAAVKGVASALADSMNVAAANAQRMAGDFIKLQKTMQGISALSGQKNNNQFTLAEAKKAAAANLTPDQMVSFRDAFLSKASNYVGNAPNAKLNEKDSDEFQLSMAEYAAQHGVSAGEMADFAGGLLAQQKGPTTAKEMKARAGKVFSTLEASSAKVGHLLPGMTRVMAQGLSAEEAAPVLSMMPEIAPEEESTHLLRVLAEVRRLSLEGKGGQFGIGKDMTMEQKLEALVNNLADRSGKGENLDKMLQEVTHEDIAANTLRGLVGQGRKGFDQWKGILAKTPDNAVDLSIQEGRDTDAGRVMHREADAALAETERGSVWADVTGELQGARTRLTRSGKLDEAHSVQDAPRAVWGAFSSVTPEQQRVNTEAIQDVFHRARRVGVDTGTTSDFTDSTKATSFAAVGSQQEVNQLLQGMLDGIKRQNQLAEEANKQRAEQAKGKVAVPIAAPPMGNPAERK